MAEALWKEQLNLERQQQPLRGQEEWVHQGHRASLSLPEERAIRRIVRYEATTQRELHRSIRELRYLRKMGGLSGRKGKN